MWTVPCGQPSLPVHVDPPVSSSRGGGLVRTALGGRSLWSSLPEWTRSSRSPKPLDGGRDLDDGGEGYEGVRRTREGLGL